MQHIAYNYIDKERATTRAIGDYREMKNLYNLADEKLKELEESLQNMNHSQLGERVKGSNTNKIDYKYAKVLDSIDYERRRLDKAKEFLQWFDSGLEKLQDEDRKLISKWINDTRQDVTAIMREENRSRSSLYYTRRRAIKSLSTFLYW